MLRVLSRQGQRQQYEILEHKEHWTIRLSDKDKYEYDKFGI